MSGARDGHVPGAETRHCTEKSGGIVDFYLSLAAALVTLRMFIRRATNRYRWDGRPTTRRLK